MSTFMNCYNGYKAKGHSAIQSLRACMKTKPVPKPASMRALIHAQTGCANRDIKIGDRHFDTICIADMQTFLAEDETDLQTYIAEKHDCEDFARRLGYFAHEYFLKRDKNVAFIELWGPVLLNGKVVEHGINGFVTPDRILTLIEPQTDEMYRIKDYLRGKPSLVIMR